MSTASINKKVRETISQKGQKLTIEVVSQMFNEIDTDHKGGIDTDEEFDKFILGLGVTLNNREKRTFIRSLNSDDDDKISLSCFLSFLLPDIPKQRKKAIEESFKNLSPDKDSNITRDVLIERFGNNEFTTIGGRKVLVSQLVDEILKMFDLDHDGKFSEADFINYYKELSSSFDNDEYFSSMIKASWSI